MQKCSGMTDVAIGHMVPALCGLRTLRLGWCFRVTAKAIASLAALTRLHTLELAHTKLDDATLAILASSLPRLKDLNLRGCAISDRGLTRCTPLARLEVLCLRTCEIGNAAVEALIAMPRLTELDLAYTELSDPGLAAMAPLTKLQSLSLDSCRLSAGALHGLARFPRLRTLDLSDVEAPRFTVEALTALPHLTSLNLFYVGIGDHEVIHLTKLTNLAELNLDSRFISDAAMPALAAIPSLTRLDLFGSRTQAARASFPRAACDQSHASHSPSHPH